MSFPRRSVEYHRLLIGAGEDLAYSFANATVLEGDQWNALLSCLMLLHTAPVTMATRGLLMIPLSCQGPQATAESGQSCLGDSGDRDS